jgi:hypothetical protein
MAQLRLIGPRLVASLVLASCGRSEAAPQVAAVSSGLVPPTGWHSDSALANTAAVAAADPKAGIAVAGSEAWSEPTRGCYAVWLGLRGAAAPIDVAAEQLLAALAKELPDLVVREVGKPASGAQERGALALAFEARGFHGRLRAELAPSGEVHALACVWNRREPKRCEAGCTALLGATR